MNDRLLRPCIGARAFLCGCAVLSGQPLPRLVASDPFDGGKMLAAGAALQAIEAR